MEKNYVDNQVIAWCGNGSGLTKSEVIEYLRKVVAIQANREECKRVCSKIGEEIGKNKVTSGAPVRERANISLKRVILLIFLGEFVLLCFNQRDTIEFLEGIYPWIIIFLFVGLPLLMAWKRNDMAVREWNHILDQSDKREIVLKAEYDTVKQLENSCDRTLAALYDPGVINRKYQNFPACVYILDMLENGMSHSLERTGMDPGAYYLFEKQLQNRAVVERLESIEGKIDDLTDVIVQSNRMMYNKMNEITHNVQSAVRELKHIRTLSAATAANTYATAMNTKSIAENTAAIRYNTAQTAWYSKCAALNTSDSFRGELWRRVGIA